MTRRIIGLDLGTYSVKLLRLETGKQAPRFEVRDCVEEVLPLGETGEQDLLERQAEAVMMLQKKGLLEGEICAISLSGAYGQVRTMAVPFNETHKINAVLPGLLDAEVPFELDDMIYSWYRLEKLAVGLDEGEKNDVSLIRLAFGKKAQIGKTLQMLQRFSLDPRQMHLDSVVAYETIREIGFERLFHEEPASEGGPAALAVMVDLGHSATNLCIFNKEGVVGAKTLLRGGKKLTEEIAHTLGISFLEAQKLKHELVDFDREPIDELAKKVCEIARNYFQHLGDQILRSVISYSTSTAGAIRWVVLRGGGAHTPGIEAIFRKYFETVGAKIISLDEVLPPSVRSPSMSSVFSLAVSCLHLHAKESRFNFRKAEFAWRGELDFLRTNSVSLILWGLIVICSMTVLWSAKSMVLEKENQRIEAKLKEACVKILNEKNITASKCLALMKGQIATNADVGVPEYTASNIYVNLAQFLPNSLDVKISEMEISENRVRLSAETKGFEEVDKVISRLKEIPCFTNVESGRAQAVDSVVRFSPTSDIDCKAKKTDKAMPERGM